MSISEGDSGKILLKCHAGCATEAVIEAANLTWGDLAGSSKSGSRSKDDPVIARYDYLDEEGKPLFRVCRTRSKGFFQERFEPSTGRYIPGLNGTRRVLYHLPELLIAETVFVTEGEKDCDKLASLGLAATTNPGGAGKWYPDYREFLNNKNVVIFPDNDEPGRNHAIAIAQSVLSVARSVKVVSLPDLPPKGDVSDFLASHSKDELLALVEAGGPFTGNAKQNEFWPNFLTAKDLLALPADTTRWVWDQTLPFGGASVTVAKPKIGKTTFCVNLTIAIARGIPFLGRNTIQCPVAYLSLDASLPEIAETFTRFGLTETDPVFIHAGAAPKEAVTWVTQRIRENGIRFIVVDTLQRLFRFQKINDYSEVINTLEPMLEAVRKQNAHVMFVHHARKDAGDDFDSAIGSTAIRGMANTYLHLKRLPNSERRILRTDQRAGKNIPELQIGFGADDWLEITGTMEEAEIDEVKPKLRELLETQEGDLTEKDIRAAIPIRGIIVSKALKDIFQANELERTGKGKKNNPFRYSLAITPSNDDCTNTCPRGEGVGEGISGQESEKQQKGPGNTTEIRVPEIRDTNGTRMDTNRKIAGPGHESEDEQEILI